MKWERAPQLPLVYLASMTDSRHLHSGHCVVDCVHYAVVTHADAPLLIAAFQLLAARRQGIGDEIFQARSDARDHWAGQPL